MSTKPLRIVAVLLAVAILGSVVVLLWPAQGVAEGLPEGPAELSNSSRAPLLVETSPIAPAPFTDGTYSAPVGRSLKFTYDARFDTAMSFGDKEGNPLVMTAKGEMNVEVVARQGEELLARVTFPNSIATIESDAGSQRGEALEKCLALATVVRMHRDGPILGYRFPSALNAEARNMIRTLFSGHRFVIPAEVTGTWKTTEADATGMFEAEYKDVAAERAGRSLEKRKLGYLAAGPDGTTSVTSGVAEGVHDKVAGWMGKVTIKESLRLEDPEADIKVRFETLAGFSLLSWTDAKRAAPGEFLWSDPNEAPACGRGDVDPATEVDPAVMNANVPSLLVDLDRAAAANDFDALRELHGLLAAVVAARPEVLPVVQSYVVDPSTPEATANAVLSAVATADTKPAESVLALVATADEVRESVRIGAVTSVLSLSKPGPEIVTALNGLVDNAEAPSAVRNSSFLMLGLCAGRGLGEEETRARMDGLLAREEQAKQSGDVETWLLSLGNSKSSSVVEPASRYLKSTDPRLREAAVQTLRHVAGPAARQLLVNVASTEGEPRTRGRAVSVLAGMSDPEAFKVTERVITSDPSRAVREQAVRGLARRFRDDPAARGLVEIVAASDASPELRQMARRMLEEN